MKRTLFTIGYEGLDFSSFVRQLSRHKVEVLVDVRELALSRKKGFSKTALGEGLQKRGIEYIHFPKLGSPRTIRKKLHKDGNYESFFRSYGKHLARQRDAFRELLDLTQQYRRVCFMCFEEEPKRCHRTPLADHVAEKFPGNLAVHPVRIYA